MEIDDIASELYGLAPEDFTATRNARAKQAATSGDRALADAVRGLRKPTVGAWLLNQLVRRYRADVEQAFELGARLRAAQGTLGAAELRALGEQRRRLTRALAQQAAGIGQDAGRKVSAQVVAEVEESLRSAMVDPDAGTALATGLLVDTFSATGLEPVHLERVLALGSVTGRSPPAVDKGAEGDARAEELDRRAIADARRVVAQADEAVRSAAEASQEARRRAGEARRRWEDLQSELDVMRRRLEELEDRVAAAAEAEESARRSQLPVTRAERSALEAAERARRRLETLIGRRDG